MLKVLKFAAVIGLASAQSACGLFNNGGADQDFCHFEAEMSAAAYDEYAANWGHMVSQARLHYYETYGHLTIVHDNLYYFADICGSDPLSIWAPSVLRDHIELSELSREEFARRVDAVVIQAHPPPPARE